MSDIEARVRKIVADQLGVAFQNGGGAGEEIVDDLYHRLAADAVPEGRHLSLHLNLIAHGRQVCRARRPDCPRCGLRDLCRFYARTQGDGQAS